MSESLIIQIPLGLPGLTTGVSFELRARSPGSAYAWLRSTTGPSIELLAIDVLSLRRDYPIDQLRRNLAFLHLDDDEPLLALALCTVPQRPAAATANLLAPVVVGLRSRKAAQIVLHDPRWSEDAPLPG
ncbi:flagellar assembly protein FliW [Paraliomyxa miuraensis]|uniref:flagellar assembly protein FliW n=1 Tax=Paraliomyxa miuraensis TaxID=376150 RepID=UPI0022560E2E|nr:flagellar assembly protein FliW [Paraliomyxa miuraensis]MCX4245943.1 flagellar assembly protein FliW [Paraliomyxa miuraensis]